MSQINAFDRDNLRVLRIDLQAALNAVGTKYGVALTLGNARFTNDNVTFKTEGSVIRAAGVVTKVAAEFKDYADLLGLEPSDLGKTFVHGGKRFEIVGAKLSCHKFPIQGKMVGTTKIYKFQAADVRRALGKGVPKAAERFMVTEDDGEYFVLDTQSNRRLRGPLPNGNFVDEIAAQMHADSLNAPGVAVFPAPGFNNRHED